MFQGPAGSLRKKIQAKFYVKGDSHGEWGHKMDSMVWSCEANSTGAVNVTGEQFL